MSRSQQRNRQGLALLCVLSCLIVASALVATSVQMALRGRREARLQLQLRQTELLCEAGVLRAAQKLRASADYEGEHWCPELDSETYSNAVVDINVATASENATNSNSTARDVTVIAKLDSTTDSDGPMQRTHRFTFQAPVPSTSPESK